MCTVSIKSYVLSYGKNRKPGLPTDLYIELFQSTVLPIVLCGCEVWGYYIIGGMKVLYMKSYIKHILGVHNNTCKGIVDGDLLVHSGNICYKWNDYLLDTLTDR